MLTIVVDPTEFVLAPVESTLELPCDQVKLVGVRIHAGWCIIELSFLALLLFLGFGRALDIH